VDATVIIRETGPIEIESPSFLRLRRVESVLSRIDNLLERIEVPIFHV